MWSGENQVTRDSAFGAVFTQSDCFAGSPSSALFQGCGVKDSLDADQLEVKPSKTLFIGAIKHTGEPLARISAQTPVEKMALASLLRIVLSQIEAELQAAIPLATAQDQASNIRRAA